MREGGNGGDGVTGKAVAAAKDLPQGRRGRCPMRPKVIAIVVRVIVVMRGPKAVTDALLGAGRGMTGAAIAQARSCRVSHQMARG